MRVPRNKFLPIGRFVAMPIPGGDVRWMKRQPLTEGYAITVTAFNDGPLLHATLRGPGGVIIAEKDVRALRDVSVVGWARREAARYDLEQNPPLTDMK